MESSHLSHTSAGVTHGCEVRLKPDSSAKSNKYSKPLNYLSSPLIANVEPNGIGIILYGDGNSFGSQFQSMVTGLIAFGYVTNQTIITLVEQDS